MPTEPLFWIPRSSELETITITFEGQAFTVPAGVSVATALLVGGVRDFRSSAVRQASRAPYCMMGVCFECLVEIDGVPARQSCIVQAQDGMQVRRQLGAAALDDVSFRDEP